MEQKQSGRGGKMKRKETNRWRWFADKLRQGRTKDGRGTPVSIFMCLIVLWRLGCQS